MEKMKEETKAEINYYKTKTIFQIKMIIFMFKILRKINNKTFYFCLSLFPGLLIGNYVFNIPPISILITHFVFWFFYNEKLFNTKKINDTSEQVDFLIEDLSEHVKTKKGVK
jgi:hypothetical protein